MPCPPLPNDWDILNCLYNVTESKGCKSSDSIIVGEAVGIRYCFFERERVWVYVPSHLSFVALSFENLPTGLDLRAPVHFDMTKIVGSVVDIG